MHKLLTKIANIYSRNPWHYYKRAECYKPTSIYHITCSRIGHCSTLVESRIIWKMIQFEKYTLLWALVDCIIVITHHVQANHQNNLKILTSESWESDFSKCEKIILIWFPNLNGDRGILRFWFLKILRDRSTPFCPIYIFFTHKN